MGVPDEALVIRENAASRRAAMPWGRAGMGRLPLAKRMRELLFGLPALGLWYRMTRAASIEIQSEPDRG